MPQAAEAIVTLDAAPARPTFLDDGVVNDVGGLTKSEAFVPAPYHLVRDAMLYQEAKPTSANIRVLTAGQQVLPLKMKGPWVEVVVADDGSHKGSFGWIRYRDGLYDLLERDARVKFHRPPPKMPP